MARGSMVLMLGTVALFTLLLANHITIASDPDPAVSWAGHTERDDIVLQTTFQLGRGDRLFLDVGLSVFALDVITTNLTISAALVDGNYDEPIRTYHGVYASYPSRGQVLEPEPPRWVVDADGELTYVLRLTPERTGIEGEEPEDVWADALAAQLAMDDGSPRHFDVLPRTALLAQPFFYAAQAVAAAAILAAAWWSRHPLRGDASLEGRLRLAAQAREWLEVLHRMVFVNLVVLIMLATVVALWFEGIETGVRASLHPDGFYQAWTRSLFVLDVSAAVVGLAVLLRRLRAAMAATPLLEMHE